MDDKFIIEFVNSDLKKYFELNIKPIPFRCHLYYEYLWKVKKEITFTTEQKKEIAFKIEQDYINNVKLKVAKKYRDLMLNNLMLNKSLLYLQQQAILLEHINPNRFNY